jgi:hypothetical protein
LLSETTKLLIVTLMKKANKNSRHTADSLAAAVSIDEFDFLEEVVKDLATRRYDIGYCRESVPAGWNAIDTSSIEAYVSGTIAMADDTEHSIIPFTTCFFFTCSKVKRGEYDLSWISSLS